MSQSQKESEMGKALLQHCANSDVKRVTTLIGNGMDEGILHYQNNAGSTALIVACGIGSENVSLKLVNVLLAAEVPLHTTNKNGMNALMMAASMGFPTVVRRLLEEDADYTAKNKDGKSAMQLTKNRMVKELITGVIEAKAEAEKLALVREYGTQLIDCLLEENLAGVMNIIDKNSYVEVYNVAERREGCPFTRPIEIAVHLCMPAAVEALLAAGADPDVTHAEDDSTCVIRLCAQSRAPSYPSTEFARDKERMRFEMLDYLVTIGKASLNGARKDSWTALMLAADQGHVEVMRLLLNNKANANVLEKHTDSALILAIKRNRVEAVKCLLEAKAKPDICGAEGMSGLMWAAYKNNVEIIQLLVRVNTKMNMRAKCGRTAMCFAVQQKNEEAVSAIVRAGSADPNIPVLVTQATPLILASRSNSRALVSMLLEDSVILVKLNQQNNNGETALFWAASYGNVEIVTQLLIAGGNPYIKNREGHDAYSITKDQDVKDSISENTLDIFKPK